MLFRSTFLPLCALTSTFAAPAVKERGPSGFNWGHKKIRGVNIGGWLVLEPWITPSIFDQFPESRKIVDEYTLTQSLGAQRAHDKVLRKHWESWVTRKDFQKIADAGFNMVRIPIGYWAYDNSDSPYAKGAAPFLDTAIEWARSVGLKVVIDLHSAPGSQNCFDNSGQRCGTPQWGTGNTVERTLRVLKRLQKKYGSAKYDDVMAGIELLNEPLAARLNLDTIKQFTRDGYGNQREVSQTRVVIFHDGFQSPNSYNGFLTPSDAGTKNVAIDHHEYQIFSSDLMQLSPAEHRQQVCKNVYNYYGADKWTIVGEWSAAMTDCAKHINGYKSGARYEGTFETTVKIGSCAGMNDIKTWSQEMKDNSRGYIEAQLEAFEHNAQGWLFWNFKTEGSSEWDAFALLDAGVFPQPLTSRKFGKVCT